jgi:ubiquinone/menaquinone biosynthesis C-methylase UbiE
MYEHEYEAMFGLEDIYWWFVARRQLAVEIVAREIGGRGGLRLLDVGCGTGSNLAAFSELAEASGIDMSTEALTYCRERGVERVALSAVERLPFADASFDVVTAMDMLEHTDDDLAALAELRRVLKPGGLLLATVPAYGFLWSEHDEALKHRRRYTAHELRNKLTVKDFRIERTSYFITTLFFPILVARIHQGLFKKSTHPQTSVKMLPRWINATLVGLLSAERWAFRHLNLPFGVSIVALARPRDNQPALTSGVATASVQPSLPRSSTT